MESRYQVEGGGMKCHVVASLIRFCGSLTRPINHRLYYRMTEQIGRFADRDQICIVRLAEDTRFAFKIADAYWNRMLHRHYRYEPEITAALRLSQPIDYSFLDLGANLGFWSVMASSAAFGSRRTIAVEPVGANFEMLTRNRALNGERFEIRKAAITETTCGDVAIKFNPSSISNVSASVVSEPASYASGHTEMVPSISIDELVVRESCADMPLVIKLDVEGLEIDAMEGAKKTLERDVLIIYEDHGKDDACRVSDYVLGLGLKVFHGEGDPFTPVTKIEQVQAIKTDRWKGYNLFAFKDGSVFAQVFAKASTH